MGALEITMNGKSGITILHAYEKRGKVFTLMIAAEINGILTKRKNPTDEMITKFKNLSEMKEHINNNTSIKMEYKEIVI